MRLLRRCFVLLAVLPAFAGLAACGGDGSGGGSEEEYVRQLCTAFGTFDRTLNELINNSDAAEDGSATVEQRYKEAFLRLVEDLEKANPPSSVREYHEVLTAEVRRVAEAIERGDLESAFADESQSVELPRGTNDRLREVARNVEECQGVGFFGE